MSPGFIVRGHNGWENSNVWDFALWVVDVDWDGKLPDTVGFGGQVVKKRYNAHERQIVLSWEMIMPDTGTFVIDSCFFRPNNAWKLFGVSKDAESYEEVMAWDGPHTFQVVKE